MSPIKIQNSKIVINLHEALGPDPINTEKNLEIFKNYHNLYNLI